jgi:exopolysaccharide biosynthesis polyprenyl glycosylphosphotransferase
MVPESAFAQAVYLERKRAERSGKFFVLMLLEVRPPSTGGDAAALLHQAAPVLRAAIRETDIAGWHKKDTTIGIIFAEFGGAERDAVLTALRTKLTAALHADLQPDKVERLQATFHCFPDDWTIELTGQPPATLYPEIVARQEARRAARVVKRSIDLLGATVALLVLAPVLVVAAIAIKLTSPGPVLFKQTRIGQYGMPFTCLKFRSMHAVNDDSIHKDYVRRFIAGHVDGGGAETNGKAVYKLTRDPRLTPIGRFLRKTSLDEVPQFFNVLSGHMSLVGPRPPVPYELEAYEVWHRHRLLVKPGITGLWQVSGRSRLRFDDMVRLDLKYAAMWSLWLDIKILLQTPHAVFSGEGAY